jgi:hypothetical protein
MATRNIVFGSGSGNKEIDVIDIGAIVALPIAASMMFGVFSLTVDVFGGFDFTSAIWTLGGTDVTMALLLATGSVAWIAVTNFLNEDTDMGQYEAGAVVTALALPVLYQFIPAVADLVEYGDITRFGAFLYVSVAAVYISYTG